MVDFQGFWFLGSGFELYHVGFRVQGLTGFRFQTAFKIPSGASEANGPESRRSPTFLLQSCTWTPKVGKIMAFMAVILGLGLLLCMFWGLGKDFQPGMVEGHRVLTFILRRKADECSQMGLMGRMRMAMMMMMMMMMAKVTMKDEDKNADP